MLRTESVEGGRYPSRATPPGHTPQEVSVYSASSGDSSNYHTPSLASIYQVRQGEIVRHKSEARTLLTSAKSSIRRFIIMEKAPTTFI